MKIRDEEMEALYRWQATPAYHLGSLTAFPTKIHKTQSSAYKFTRLIGTFEGLLNFLCYFEYIDGFGYLGRLQPKKRNYGSLDDGHVETLSIMLLRVVMLQR